MGSPLGQWTGEGRSSTRRPARWAREFVLQKQYVCAPMPRRERAAWPQSGRSARARSRVRRVGMAPIVGQRCG